METRFSARQKQGDIEAPGDVKHTSETAAGNESPSIKSDSEGDTERDQQAEIRQQMSQEAEAETAHRKAQRATDRSCKPGV